MKASTTNLIEKTEQKLRLINNLKALPWTVFTKEGEVAFIYTLTDQVQSEMKRPNLSRSEVGLLTILLIKIKNLSLTN